VCVIGSRVGIHQYFGGSSSHSSWPHSAKYEEKLTQLLRQQLKQEITKKVKANLFDEVTDKVIERVIRQLQLQFDSYGICPQVTPRQNLLCPHR